jgi:hypothetical protein
MKMNDKTLNLLVDELGCDPEDEIELPMWDRILEEKPTTCGELTDLVQDYTGWSDRDAEDYAKSSWKLAKKVAKLNK